MNLRHICWLLVLLECWVSSVQAQNRDLLEIRITQGVESALPIAIVPFDWHADVRPSVDVTAIIGGDLRSSGRFAPMPAADLPARPGSFADVNFKDWRLYGMDNLVIGKVKQIADDQFSVEFRIIDVVSTKQLAGFRIPTDGAPY